MTDKLKEAVKEFFNYLDTEDESESGKVFHPIFISCSRCLLTEKLHKCLSTMREEVLK